MPRHLSNFRNVEKGDVLLVKSEYLDNDAGKLREWFWYGIVEEKRSNYSAKCRRLGAEGKYATKLAAFHKDEIQIMDPEEWPDGVIALRTSLILRGEIDID